MMAEGLEDLGDIDFSNSVGSSDLFKEPIIGAMEKASFLWSDYGMNAQKILKKGCIFLFKLLLSFKKGRSRGIFFWKKKNKKGSEEQAEKTNPKGKEDTIKGGGRVLIVKHRWISECLKSKKVQ